MENTINRIKIIANSENYFSSVFLLARLSLPPRRYSFFSRQNSSLNFKQKMTGMMNFHESCYEQSANVLFGVHNQLKFAEEAPYDVITAVDVLTSGSYRRLPSGIEHPITSLPPEPDGDFF